MNSATADLFDEHGDELQVLEPGLSDFGGRATFSGEIATVRCYQDNSLVRERVAEPGEGRVLVVDGGGSLRCALLGDRLAALAVENGWSGIVLFGCIRDSVQIAEMDLGVKALDTNPRKSTKRGQGLADVPVEFGGVRFEPGHYLYADADGVVVAERDLAG